MRFLFQFFAQLCPQWFPSGGDAAPRGFSGPGTALLSAQVCGSESARGASAASGSHLDIVWSVRARRPSSDAVQALAVDFQFRPGDLIRNLQRYASDLTDSRMPWLMDGSLEIRIRPAQQPHIDRSHQVGSFAHMLASVDRSAETAQWAAERHVDHVGSDRGFVL